MCFCISQKVEIYTANKRGTPWNEWRRIERKENCGIIVRTHLRDDHSRYISLRFFQWTNGYVGITRLLFGFVNGSRGMMMSGGINEDESGLITAVYASGCYNNYPLSNMFKNDGSYWCTRDGDQNPFVTFDCDRHRVSRIWIAFHPSYFAKHVTVYTMESRGSAPSWNEWTVLTEKRGCGAFVDLQIDREHFQFICLRFKEWTNGYVGVSHIRFLLDSNINDFNAMDIMPSAPPPEYEEEPGMITYGHEMNDEPPPAFAVQTDSEMERAPTFGIEGGGINGGVTGGHHVVDIGGGTAATSEVEMWLNGLGPSFCSEYLHLFQENGFDEMAVIATMNDADLQSIGVSKMGHRRKMLMEIKKI